MWFLGAELLRGIVVFLLFFCHEDVLTSKVKGAQQKLVITTDILHSHLIKQSE